jgi:hypothetical protein
MGPSTSSPAQPLGDKELLDAATQFAREWGDPEREVKEDGHLVFDFGIHEDVIEDFHQELEDKVHIYPPLDAWKKVRTLREACDLLRHFRDHPELQRDPRSEQRGLPAGIILGGIVLAIAAIFLVPGVVKWVAVGAIVFFATFGVAFHLRAARRHERARLEWEREAASRRGVSSGD